MTRQTTLAPQQARSRESTRRLLKAAAEVLGQHGVDGTTIPRIAKHAGLTPGAIYRRFADKDALLETMVLGIIERQDERLRELLTPEMARQIPLPVLVEQLIDSMLISYRANAGLLRAIRHFVGGRDQTAFFSKICKIEMRSFEYLIELLLEHRKRIKHPDPRTAIAFAVMMLSSTLTELILADRDMKNWQALLPKDHQSLKRELKRMFLSYLAVDLKAT
jgi:AcrR family transcriptional regulator